MDNASAVRAVLVTLYSVKYPAIGESHGLSVVAGALHTAFQPLDLQLRVMDMVQWGEEKCDRIVEAIHQNHANVLAVGMPYGTFSVLRTHYQAMRCALYGDNPLVLVGGPIATYMSESVLNDIDPEAIVIVGEAEYAAPLLVDRWLHRRSYADVPNVHYIDRVTGAAIRTPRQLADIGKGPKPYRGHVQNISKQGGQIFAETSRGCSWAACTFCLRGLTDVTGRSHEYRRKDVAIVASDLGTLHELGITDVTFADEDFLGGPLTESESFIDSLEAAISASPGFDASLTVHSVYSRRDSTAERRRRTALLAKLADIGLQKVFLGIESCSPSQLKRYAKGHTRDEAAAAALLLQQLGIRVEIGVILFDPLCTLDEVEESLVFMRNHSLAALASGLSSCLRLQTASHYCKLLDKYEKQHGLKLFSRKLDPDTLSYPYNFLHPSVQDFVDAVQHWNICLHSLYYPAKSLSRFGAGGALGEAVHPLRDATQMFRDQSCDALLAAIGAVKQGGDPRAVLAELFSKAAGSLASAVLTSLRETPSASLARHPVVQQALGAAKRYAAIGHIPGSIS
jgi:Radical SAM superfamily